MATWARSATSPIVSSSDTNPLDLKSGSTVKVPSMTEPNAAEPNAAEPNATVSTTPAPGTASPTTTPGSVVPDTTAAGTTAPDAAAPGTVAPSTVAPDTLTPDTAAPDCAAPHTTPSSTTPFHAVPNHHAHYPGFAGLAGIVAAATMSIGRQGDARLVARLSGLVPGDTVVDVGCGPGAAARRAARTGASVTGVDPAQVMLRVARLLTRSSRRVRYLRGAAEDLPLPDDAASVLWTIASVHHWTDVDAGLREVRRVLKPGGRFVALERRSRPDAHGLAGHGWTDQRAAAFAERCVNLGFIQVQVDRHETGRRKTVSVTATAP